MTEKQKIGLQSELNARRYLENKGLVFVDNNYKYKSGEIDLVMKDNEILVFVEVRFRHYSEYGNSLESITKTKQHRIIRTALHYLQHNNQLDQIDCRFDAVGIDAKQTIIWIKNAFEVQY